MLDVIKSALGLRGQPVQRRSVAADSTECMLDTNKCSKLQESTGVYIIKVEHFRLYSIIHQTNYELGAQPPCAALASF